MKHKEGKKEGRKKNQSIQDQWDNTQQFNKKVTGIPEGEEKKKEAKQRTSSEDARKAKHQRGLPWWSSG